MLREQHSACGRGESLCGRSGNETTICPLNRDKTLMSQLRKIDLKSGYSTRSEFMLASLTDRERVGEKAGGACTNFLGRLGAYHSAPRL